MMELVMLRILTFTVLGALLAAAYVAALALNVRLYTNSATWWLGLVIHAARLFAIVAAFTIFAGQSALALVSSLLGFQMIRTVVINHYTPAFEHSLPRARRS
jgi:hypothetical protein